MLAPPEHPTAIQGVLDLRDWDWGQENTITLNGAWEFYPRQLIVSRASSSSENITTPVYIQVPGNWKAVEKDKDPSPIQFGSYRLRILTDERVIEPLGLLVAKIYSASEIYLNGKLIAGSGQPSDQKEYIASDTPYSASFLPTGDEIELIIQVANFSTFSESGIAESLKFGLQKNTDAERQQAILFQWVTFSILMLHALYAGMLYFFNRRQKSLVYFFMLLICSSLSVLTSDDKLLLTWIPLDFEWSTKLQLLAYTGIGFFMLILIKSLSTEYERGRSFHWYFYFNGAYSIFLILAPFNWITPLTIIIFLVILVFPTFAVQYMTIKMIRKQQQDAIYILLASTSATASVFWGIIKSIGILPTPFYPLDIIATVIGFSAYWFKQYFRNSEQTSRLAEQLQHTDKLKDKFLANTAHELRTPLHGIINIAHTLRHNDITAFGSKNHQDLELIITIGQRMSYLLNDLLDLNRLQEKRITLNARPVAVQALAAGVLDILRMMTEGKPIKLAMDIPEHFPDVHADEQRMIQILFNLVHNAIKFTNEGTIAIQGFVQEQTAYIQVRDTGVGMDEETQRRVFKAYEQGPLQSVGGGIGLGLSICKQLVELHGGTLHVKSAPGEGTIFTFSLPLAEKVHETSAQLEEPIQIHDLAYQTANSTATNLIDQASNIVQTYLETAAASSVSERAKILAVDDDPVNLKILVRLLSAEQYEITTALSGKEALELLENNRWDLIIADVMMPQMSGYEFTRLVRQRHTISELPVLLLTARSQSEDVYSGFLSGANDYVTKPVDAMELNYRVQALTTLGHSIRQRLRMEAAYLQAQIQPHFLFNTLNSITVLGDMDIEKMQRLIEAFSSYLRISFDFWNTEQLVPLEHELELVRSYLYIEKERFQDRLSFEWEVQADLDLRIPPLTIQPLVENALRHGILTRISGGTVKIRIQEHADYTAFLISDNGVGIDKDKVSGLLKRTSGDTRRGIGLVNTNRRLLQWCGKGLLITSTPGEGTSISFAIPKSKTAHYDS